MIICNQISTVFHTKTFIFRIYLYYYYKYILQMQNKSQNHKKAVQRLRTIVKVNLAYKKWVKQMRNTKHRYNVLKEWAETQASYIQDLKIIEKDIQFPLKQAQLISDQQDRLLFPNMKAMIHLSENMLACIQATIKAWTPNDTLIGENLMFFYKFFMIYRDYCNNFMKAEEIVKGLRQNPKVLKIQQNLKLKEIAAYTIKPVQRPPKYQLLLRQYHKVLPKCHKDYNIIKQAIQKYHEVNELNNQSMDRQIRADIMIKLDKKHGNVISSRTGRQYLKEFTCKCISIQCTIYAFNDMLLLVQKKGKDNEQVYKRLYLDWTSYSSFKIHYKHFFNMVLICGANKSAHLEFQNIANAKHFQQTITMIIKNLCDREEERRIRFNENQVRRKNLAKFRVIKWDNQIQNKIVYKPKLQIKVISTLLSKSDTFFFLVQFKVINPHTSSQTIILSFDKMGQVYDELKYKYRQTEFPKVKMLPEHIGLIEATTNKHKLAQYRAFLIQQFLNFVFRNEELYTVWRTTAMQIGINFDLFSFATSENFTCTCNLCIEMKQNQKVAYYRHLLKPPKSFSNKFGSKSSIQVQSTTLSYRKSQIHILNNPRASSKPCPIYIFKVFHSIKNAEKSANMSFPDKMLSLQIEMGQINYSYLIPEQVPLPSNVSLKVYLLSIQQQYIEITLKQDRYVRQVLEEIAQMSSLDTVYDWNLYIYYDKEYTRIPNDEKILDFVKKWDIDIEKTEQQIDKDSFFRSRIDDIRKWGQQFWGGMKGKIFMKKSLHFEHQTQMAACNANKQRYHFLIGEVFGRIKYQSMYLTYDQTVQLCAFYLLKKQFSKVKHFTQENIDLSPLRELLPAFFHPYIRKDKFRKELLDCIKAHYSQLQAHQDSRNAIELVYIKILQFLRDNQEWLTGNFKMSTYHGQHQNDVILGISCNLLTVMRQRDRTIILSIELQRLKYKTSAQSIFIYEAQNTYRYDGRETQSIRQLIETYIAYAELFKFRQ